MAPRILITGDPGSGCSSNQYAQFNTAAFAVPPPRREPEPRSRVGAELSARLLRQDGRPGAGAQLPPRRQPQHPVPPRGVQRVQRRRSSTRRNTHAAGDEPAEPDGRPTRSTTRQAIWCRRGSRRRTPDSAPPPARRRCDRCRRRYGSSSKSNWFERQPLPKSYQQEDQEVRRFFVLEDKKPP